MALTFSNLQRGSVLVTAAAILGLAGCGGSGGGTTTNQFAGTYKGSAIAGGSLSLAEYDVTIDTSGNVTGSVISQNTTTSVTGTVSSTGTMNVVGNGQTFTGTLAKPDPTVAGVTLTQSGGGGVIYVLFVQTLAVRVTGASPFLGQFIGTDTNTANQSTGPLVFSIDGGGNVTGEILTTNTSNVVEIVDLAGTVSSSGVISLTGSVNGSTTGTLTGNGTVTGNTITGTLSSSDGKNLTFTVTNTTPAV